MDVPVTKRLRAGGIVAKEKASGIPYRSLNVRRGNAMRYLVLDYIKQRPYADKQILLPTLTEEKRKAMENIAANEFFRYADAYSPEEHFFPLHVKPSGELYYIPEKKVKQMLYIVNKLKRCSLESIVSDVTWESSSISGADDDNQFILDFKTDKVLAKANHCEFLAHEIEQFYFAKSADVPDTSTTEEIGAVSSGICPCDSLRRSISLPIIKVPKGSHRLRKLSTLNKTTSDDNLNAILADINQHQLPYIRSSEKVKNQENTTLIDENLKVVDDSSQYNSTKYVHFASNDNQQHLINDVSDVINKGPTFYDLIDQNDDIDAYDEINDTIYREISEVKASICGVKDKMGKKFRLTEDDLNIHFDNYNKYNMQSMINEETNEECGDISLPSTSRGVYQKQMKSLEVSDDEKDIPFDNNFTAGERYLMEKLLKDAHLMDKTKQKIKMKHRVKLNDNVVKHQLTSEKILDQIKNKPKRFNVYTLQKLQTEFDTSTIGDTRDLKTITSSIQMNQPETLSTIDGSEIEMKSFTSYKKKNESESITDCEMSDVDENINKKQTKKFKKKLVYSKRDKLSPKKLTFNLSNIPIIGRFFQTKS